MSIFKRGFVKYHAGSKSLGLHVGEEELGDLSLLLKKYKIKSIQIEGTPTNLSAISEYPGIEEVRLLRCKIDNLRDLAGLTKLKRFGAAFGDLADIDLEFCSNTIETINLFMLGRVKSLKRLTRKPMPRLWLLSIDSMRSYEPPDFRFFPKLKQLAVRNNNWPSLRWLSKLPALESLSIYGDKVADKDWRPLTKLAHLKQIHGMRTVFSLAARKEFSELRPDVELT